MNLFFEVFGILAILYALSSGIALGASVLLYVTLRYPPRTIISTWHYALLTGGLSLLLGTVFFAGQISQAVISADPFWPRVAARFALWGVFSVGIGIGLGGARSQAK